MRSSSPKRLTESFPRREAFGVTGQLRRAAVSILANMAEGLAKRTAAGKGRLVSVAERSLEEGRYYPEP